MNGQTHSDTETFAGATPGTARQALFVTCDEEQLCGVDLALKDLSCEPQVVESVDQAFKLPLERYLAIVLDESVVTQRFSDVLDQFLSRAPQASILVACDASTRNAVLTTLVTCTADWIAKPIDGDELVARLRRLERQSQVRAELEDSLHFIQRVADATPEMLYLFDVQDEYTVYVNRQVCSVLGCTPEGIPAEGFMFFKSAADPDDSDRVARYLAAKLVSAKDGDFVQSEYRIRDQYQRWRWIRSREIIFHRDEHGRPKQILGAAQDITDRRELEHTHALLAAIVASSDDAIIGKTLDGEIVSWNEAAERMYGYTKDEIVGQNISLLVPREQHNEVPALLEQIRRGRRVDHYETTRRCKNGTLINLSITISPIKNRDGRVTGASTIARQL